jgi:hypothetical protein
MATPWCVFLSHPALNLPLASSGKSSFNSLKALGISSAQSMQTKVTEVCSITVNSGPLDSSLMENFPQNAK